MGVVRDVIGGSLLLGPTRLGEWDTDRLVERGDLDQPPQPPTAALGDLAVTLEGPAELLAELGAAHPQGDLAGEHQPLVVAQERRELGHSL
jgi:hypothetical protein